MSNWPHTRLPWAGLRIVAALAASPGKSGDAAGKTFASAPCGIIQPNGTVQMLAENSSVDWLCSRLIMTNCTSDEERIQLCPKKCPFLERSLYSQCGSACVTAEQCGSYRPAYPYANRESRLCEPCPSYGCASCRPTARKPGVLECTSCKKRFSLSADRLECVYNTDKVLGIAYKAVGIVLCALVAAAVLLLAVCNKNAEALTRGIEHRNRCLPHQVETSPCTLGHTSEAEVIFHSRSPLFPLTVDVHSQNIVGVGLALYYNHLVFVAGVAAVSWAILTFGEEFLGLYRWSVLDCGYGAHEDDVHTVMAAYSRRRCIMALFLWATLLPASLIFARYQASAERTFDRVHTRMEDYTLSMRGFPPTAKDPLEVQAWVEGILGQRIEGVSIGYDLRAHRREIWRLLDEHLAQRDAAFEAALGVPRASACLRGYANGATMPVLREDEELIWRSGAGAVSDAGGSFTGPLQSPEDLLRSIRSSGEAFIVMKQEADVEKLFALWNQPRHLQRTGSFFSLGSSHPERAPSMGGSTPPALRPNRLFQGIYELELREVSSEPTSVVWDHMGISEPALARRAIIALGLFLVAAVAFNCLLYVPYAHYVLRFAERAGQAPTAMQTSGLGVVVSAGNTLIANCIWIGVPRLGFQRKDQADIITFVVRWVLVLVNTLALVVLTAQKLSVVGAPEDGIISGADSALRRSEELGREAALASNIFVLFVTGAFSISYVCFWCSYPLTYWQAVLLIRTGILGSDLTARDCERLLEPMEIWLPWDYASHVQLACCAFVPLFLAEPPESCASRQLCGVLLAWCGVMYCAQRVIHLRFSKETFFTTARLDHAVLVAWGFPIAQLAMTAAYWAARAMDFRLFAKVAFCSIAFLGSFVSYAMLLYKALRHHRSISSFYKKNGESYNVCLARLRYSYFNTNPIHVLLADHLPEMRLKRVAWYEAGKAYLQTADPKVHARLEAALTAAEHAPSLQREPRSLPSQLLYRARVWLAGAPQQAFQSLAESDEGLPASSRW